MYSCATYSPINTLSTRVCFMWALSSTFGMIHSKIISSTLWSRLQMFARWAPACDLLVIKIGVWSRKESKKKHQNAWRRKTSEKRERASLTHKWWLTKTTLSSVGDVLAYATENEYFSSSHLWQKKIQKRWQILVETRRYWQQPIIVFVWHHP